MATLSSADQSSLGLRSSARSSPDPLSGEADGAVVTAPASIRKTGVKHTAKKGAKRLTPKVTKHYASNNKARTDNSTPSDRAATTNHQPRSQAPAIAPPSTQSPDLLTRLQLQVYPWPDPKPADFASLHNHNHLHLRAWKEKRDEYEAMEDNDEDLDDWFVKSGNAAAYSTTLPTLSLSYSIARSFILRAKRAFRRGSTWEHFADSEYAIDSMSQARAIQDPILRAIHSKEAVDNTLRLTVFYWIRERLCTEIWLQPFVERHSFASNQRGDIVVSRLVDVSSLQSNMMMSGCNSTGAGYAFLARGKQDADVESPLTVRLSFV